jgi:cytochrome c peroxidase
MPSSRPRRQRHSKKILAGDYPTNGAKSILGEVMIYDRNLSGLAACATCHLSQEAFTGSRAYRRC